MQSEFWHNRWKNNEIGFHESTPNNNLIAHIDKLEMPLGSCWLLPLCGKTLDIAWLVSQGYRVTGIELSELAIQQLFVEMGIDPVITQLHDMKRYQADNMDIWVGDFFNVSECMLGEIDAVYDRGSLVALPKAMRGPYSAHLKAITHNAPQLLVCYLYDQNEIEGPPFSISLEELKARYGEVYNLQCVSSQDVSDKRGVNVSIDEQVWLLKPF